MQQLILPEWILTMAPDQPLLSGHGVLMADGIIQDIGPAESLLAQVDSHQVLTRPKHLLMPGLVNAHAHTPMVLLRGLGDDAPLAKWLEDHIWPAEKALMSESFIRDGMMLGMAEMVRNGITTFSEHYFLSDIAAETAQHYGMRAMIGLWMGQVPMPDQRYTSWFDQAEQIIRLASDPGLIRFCYAPHSTYLMSDDDLKRLQTLHQSHPAKIHIHLNESAEDVAAHHQQHGMSPIQRLHRFGLLSDDLIAVHMVHTADEDMALLSEQGCRIVTCSDANLKLGSGICDVPRYLHAGLTVGLGTDGAASNNDLDLLSEARTLALLTKGRKQDPTTMTALEVLRMATMGGAECLGLSDSIGSLMPGKQADMITIDLDHPNTYPHHHPIAQVVYACNSRQIQDVWIAGHHKLQHGQWTDLDATWLQSLAQTWQDKTAPFA